MTNTAIQQKALTVREELFSKKEQFEMALPKWLTVDRLLRVIFSSLLKNPKLLDCTKESLFISIMQCAQLGLEPILGRAYLIPYNNNKLVNGKWQKVLECQFQPGYQGLVDLARRSGEIKDVFAMVVYEKDAFDLEYGTNRKLMHKPYLGEDAGDPLGAYTVWENKEGLKSFEFMPLHEIYKRRNKSQAYQYAVANPKNENAQECPWIQWPEEQMKKTVVKHHSKLQPASIEFMEAVEMDDMAEIGKPSISGFLGAGMTPEISDESIINQEMVKAFDDLIPKDADRESVDAYIRKCADHFKKTVEAFKAAVIDNDEFVDFWEAYKKTLPETDPDEEIMARYKFKRDKKSFLEVEKELRADLPNMSEKVQKHFKDKFKRMFTQEYDQWLKSQPPSQGAQTSSDRISEGDEGQSKGEEEKEGSNSNEELNKNHDFVFCPNKGHRTAVELCDNCSDANKCQPYQEYRYENQ